MKSKVDAQEDLLREILAELRKLNANLERHRSEQSIMPETADDEADEMDEFE